MELRPLGHTGLAVSTIGYGAFKIGRNTGIKYPSAYDLPDEDQAHRLLNAVLDLGINLIDTAPAYGLSEERIGVAISHRRNDFVLSTKVGETYDNQQSRYDFSTHAIRTSVQHSLLRLRTDVLDIVFIHSDGSDQKILTQTDVVPTLQSLRDEGLIRAIGMSGKTPQGALAALPWADAVMVEYHLDDRSHAQVIAQAAAQGVGVIVKKGLGSGSLDPDPAIRFVLGDPAVASVVVGGLNLKHIQENIRSAQACSGLA